MPHYTSAKAILTRLREAGLIDSEGVRILPTALTSSPRTEETQGVSYCRSHFSDADIAAYFINIHYTEVHDLQASIDRLNALPHDDGTLVGLAAPSWSLTITRGRMDSDIPGNITNLVLHALGEGDVVWSERIPEAEWFTARFTHADEILSQLDSRNCGVHRSRLDDASRLQGADQYIHECIEADDGTFAMGTLDVLTRTGKPTQLRLNVFVEDQLADDLTFFFASYFPATTPSRELAENGWLIQVLPDPAGVASREDLDDAVRLLRSALLPRELATQPTAIDEASAAATARILANPFLGEGWLPLVDAIDLAITYLTPAKFWTLDCYARTKGYNPNASPYAQVVLNADGSLRLEVSGRNTAENPITQKQNAELEFLGWMPPRPAAADQRSLPNPYRVLDAGWNGRRVAELILEALTIVYETTDADFFNFGDSLQESLLNLGTLRQIEGPIFGIPATSAPHQLAAWFRSMDVLPPVIPTPELEQQLSQQHPRMWATQATPAAIDDYLFRPSVDYLRDVVPDQFAVGHAGHGANSYALSIRAAVGDVALLLQCGWGGVYRDEAKAREQWEELRTVYAELLARGGTPERSAPKQRELLVTFSDFRGRTWTVERLVDGGREVETYESGAAMLAAHFPLR